MRNRDTQLLENWDYAIWLLHILIFALPPFLRGPIWKLALGSYGKDVMIGGQAFIRYPWKVFLGSRVYIGRGANIYPSLKVKSARILIGDDVTIGPQLTIFGAGHPVDDALHKHIAHDIKIENNVYIGGNVTIRYGVVIHSGAVIAAGSVVTKDVTSGQVVGGNPAKPLSK